MVVVDSRFSCETTGEPATFSMAAPGVFIWGGGIAQWAWGQKSSVGSWDEAPVGVWETSSPEAQDDDDDNEIGYFRAQ